MWDEIKHNLLWSHPSQQSHPKSHPPTPQISNWAFTLNWLSSSINDHLMEWLLLDVRTLLCVQTTIIIVFCVFMVLYKLLGRPIWTKKTGVPTHDNSIGQAGIESRGGATLGHGPDRCVKSKSHNVDTDHSFKLFNDIKTATQVHQTYNKFYNSISGAP